MNKKALILAAGKGTRMRTTLPKPLVEFNGSPIVSHIIESFKQADINDVFLVIGHEAELVKNTIGNQVGYVYQKEQKGTAHAVSQSKEVIDWKGNDLFVFVGDSPLITAETIKALANAHDESRATCTFLTADFDMKLPYARIIRDGNGSLLQCIEEVDATEEQKKIIELLSSHFIFKADKLFEFLPMIAPHPKNGEYYLTDIINLLIDKKQQVETLKIKDYRQLVGLNTPEEVTWAEQIYRQQL